MAEVAVPDFVDSIAEELGSGSFSSLVGCEVLDEYGVFGFTAGADHGGGFVGYSGYVGGQGGIRNGSPHVVVYDAVGSSNPMRLCAPTSS